MQGVFGLFQGFGLVIVTEQAFARLGIVKPQPAGIPVQIQAQSCAVAPNPIGHRVQGQTRIRAVHELFADQRLAVERAVIRGIVTPVLANAQFGIQIPLFSHVSPRRALRADLHHKIGRLSYRPNPIGVVVFNQGHIHVERHIAIRGNPPRRIALLVVDEGIAIDPGIGTVAEMVSQRHHNRVEKRILKLSIGQGYTVRFGIKNAVLN